MRRNQIPALFSSNKLRKLLLRSFIRPNTRAVITRESGNPDLQQAPSLDSRFRGNDMQNCVKFGSDLLLTFLGVETGNMWRFHALFAVGIVVI